MLIGEAIFANTSGNSDWEQRQVMVLGLVDLNSKNRNTTGSEGSRHNKTIKKMYHFICGKIAWENVYVSKCFRSYQMWYTVDDQTLECSYPTETQSFLEESGLSTMVSFVHFYPSYFQSYLLGNWFFLYNWCREYLQKKSQWLLRKLLSACHWMLAFTSQTRWWHLSN